MEGVIVFLCEVISDNFACHVSRHVKISSHETMVSRSAWFSVVPFQTGKVYIVTLQLVSSTNKHNSKSTIPSPSAWESEYCMYLPLAFLKKDLCTDPERTVSRHGWSGNGKVTDLIHIFQECSGFARDCSKVQVGSKDFSISEATEVS